jgi:biotin carboxylase
VVAKLDLGSAGVAVRVCDDADSLDRAVAELSRAATETNKLLLEKFIDGVGYLRPLVAAEGKVLTAFTIEKLQRHPLPLGPSSVVRVADVPQIQQAVEQFVAQTRYSGFAMPEFLVERASGRANWIEFNCRPAPQTHFTQAIAGVDLCRAWHAHIAGLEIPQFRPEIGRTIALWPQEWLRDPHSPFLLPANATQDPVEDDSTLLAAYTMLKA